MNERVRPCDPAPVAPGQGEVRPAPLWHRGVAALLQAGLALAILGGAWALAREIYATPPAPAVAEPERRAPPVTAVRAAPAARGPVIEGWGEVEPLRRLALAPEAGGRVVWVSPALTPGAQVAAGDTLLRLDDREARLALRRAEAARARIAARMLVEQGQQSRARSDLERAPLPGLSESERDLILRVPQMRELEAELSSAEADVAAARLGLDRLRLTAPFEAEVVSESVETGARLAAGEQAAVLTGTGAYRVRLAVPPQALSHLAPLPGRRVRLTQPGVWPDGVARVGRVERLAPGLSATGRMAEIVVRVEDPLARAPGAGGLPRLMIGSYLRGEVEGPRLPGAVALDRAHLRAQDRVWVMTEANRLEIRKVTIAWSGPERVLITDGLAPGERVVATPLATVAPGMALAPAGPGPDGAS